MRFFAFSTNSSNISIGLVLPKLMFSLDVLHCEKLNTSEPSLYTRLCEFLEQIYKAFSVGL